MSHVATTQSEAPTPVLNGVPQFPGMIGTFMGRDALKLAVSTLRLKSTDTAVLPLYTCQDVPRAFDGRCNVVFYDVEPDLTIAADTIQRLLRTNSNVRLVLITDYFGFLQPQRHKIRELCDAHGVCLIEDCAHSLLTRGSGELGDFAVYSLRKILPLRDGGGLVARSTVVAAPKYQPRITSDVLSFLALAKSVLNVRSEKFSRARIAAGAEKMPTGEQTDAAIFPLSSFSERKLRSIRLDDVVERRRADFLSWHDFVQSCEGLTAVYRSLPSDVCPFGYPVRIRNRQQIEEKARVRGINLRVHWRIAPSTNPECTHSHALSEELLTLPLYPELQPMQRSAITEVLKSK